MPKLVCSICESDSFDNIDGFYYCNVCGSKQQNVCDIELSDEDVGGTGHGILPSLTNSTKTKQKDENKEQEDSVEKNYCTYEVFNHLLKRQCDDLIQLGVDLSIKDVVLKLWIKYLQKLKIAFLPDETENINTQSVKWKRDIKFFEIYHLDLNHAQELKKNDEIKEKVEYTFGFDTSYINEDENVLIQEDHKMSVDEISDEENQSNDDSDRESDKNDENFEMEELNNSSDVVNEKNILMTKFEWVRMPHTIALLNLGLLIIKSQFLITDLIRFIYNGKVSYFNIDEVLPSYMEFTYQEDSLMFNLLSVPQADYLRYLTSKLGQYLEIDEIELIEIKKITNRYVLDLNLPNELASVVELMIEKEAPIRYIDIKNAKYENLEAIALSYIFVSILILFMYDNYEDQVFISEKNTGRTFVFKDWMNVMQNKLKNVVREYFGCELEDVRTIEDLNSLKLANFKQRHKLRTKPYIAQYRKNDIIATLKAPLENAIDSIQNDMVNLELNNKLFFISKLDRQNLIDFSSKSIEAYFNVEKLNLIGQKGFKSMLFKSYFKEVVEPVYIRGRYMLGLQTSTLDWLLESFSDISQTRNFLKMYDYVKKLLKKI